MLILPQRQNISGSQTVWIGLKHISNCCTSTFVCGLIWQSVNCHCAYHMILKKDVLKGKKKVSDSQIFSVSRILNNEAILGFVYCAGYCSQISDHHSNQVSSWLGHSWNCPPPPKFLLGDVLTKGLQVCSSVCSRSVCLTPICPPNLTRLTVPDRGKAHLHGDAAFGDCVKCMMGRVWFLSDSGVHHICRTDFFFFFISSDFRIFFPYFFFWFMFPHSLPHTEKNPQMWFDVSNPFCFNEGVSDVWGTIMIVVFPKWNCNRRNTVSLFLTL